MSTTNYLKMGLAAVAANLFMTANTVAASMLRDPNMKLEASGGCSTGGCFDPSADMGLNGLEAQVHKARLFDSKGVDTREPEYATAPGQMFAPIGRVVANQPLPFRVNGKVEMIKGLPGTAFLVSPCLVITNYHVVFGQSKTPNKTDYSVTFHTSAGPAIGKPVMWGPKDRSGEDEDDWAAVQLQPDKCLGRQLGWYEAEDTYDAYEKKRPVTLAGFAGSSQKNYPETQLLRSKVGGITQFDGKSGLGVFLHSVGSTGGQSGSPIGYVDGGRFKVVGLHIGSRPGGKILESNYTHEKANTAISLQSVLLNGPASLVERDIRNNSQIKNRLASVSL